jgi:hypothetical protein
LTWDALPEYQLNFLAKEKLMHPVYDRCETFVTFGLSYLIWCQRTDRGFLAGGLNNLGERLTMPDKPFKMSEQALESARAIAADDAKRRQRGWIRRGSA